MTTYEIGNLRFLIEQQLEVIATLERQGLDLHDASDLLGKLMRRDEDIRRRMNGAQHVASFDAAALRPSATDETLRSRCSPTHPLRARHALGVKDAAAPYMEGDRSQSG